jgi:dihydrofolate synthase/folylpolyglutamate synthase
MSAHPDATYSALNVAARDYLVARNYIDVELVRLEPRPRNLAGKLAAVREFNECLGNPQATFPSVQVAGTSGKGSVSLALAHILTASGFATGLHVSPYLQVATEKTWIDGHYCSAQEFLSACESVRPTAERFRVRDDCPASVHGMASLALSYEVFRRRAIDWCVMETGVGGRYDLVQGLDRRLVVISDIGLDHLKTLGQTRKEIAWHKAGVMSGSELAVAIYDREIWPVLEAEAAATGCRLLAVHPEAISAVVEEGGRSTLVLHLPRLGRIEVPWTGRSRGFPVRNAALAAAAADALSSLSVPVDAGAVAKGVVAPTLPGRLERVQSRPEVYLDGAHNQQKMAALMAALPPSMGRRHLIIGATGERHFEEVLAALPEPPHSVLLTRPLLYGKAVASPKEMADRLQGWCAVVRADDSPMRGLRRVLEMAAEDDQILVTGSLYLVGQLRTLWFPWQEVLHQRTSWPRRTEGWYANGLASHLTL